MSVRDRLPALDDSWFRAVPAPVVTALSVLGLAALDVAALTLYTAAMSAALVELEQMGAGLVSGRVRYLIGAGVLAPAFSITGVVAALAWNELGYDYDVRTAATGAAGIGTLLYVGAIAAEVLG